MMFPVISLSGAATFNGANNIGRLPARPFVTPKTAVKKKAGNSPEIVGFRRGATQSSRSGINNARNDDIKISCLRDHVYGTAANTFPLINIYRSYFYTITCVINQSINHLNLQ